MTTASELFYTRRSRLGSASASAPAPAPASAPSSVDLGFDSSPRWSFHHPCNRRRHHTTNHSHDHLHDHALLRRRRRQECDSVSLSLGGRQSSLDTSRSADIFGRIRNPPGSSERLPGSVLLARERLLQRLRGISLSENRVWESSQASSGIHSHEHAGNDFRLINRYNLETEIHTGPTLESTHITALISQGDEIPFLQPWKKKPPGLTQEALSSLKVEVFSCTGGCIDGAVSRLSQDCSICLESFREGDGLLCLPCKHRFHSTCLSSWLRCCGDCPYCRKIVVQDHARGERLLIPEF